MTSGLRPWRGSTPSGDQPRPALRFCSGTAAGRLVEDCFTGLVVIGWIKAACHQPPATAFRYRAISRAIILLKGASAGGIEPQALAPAVQSCSATDVLFSIASL